MIDRGRSGALSFTLVEILVALAILTILLAFLFSFTTQINKVWQQTLADTERRQNNRSLIDFVATEIRSAAVSLPPGAAGNAATGTNAVAQATWGGATAPVSLLQFIIDPAGPAAPSGQAVFWQAPIATDSSAGNMAEIGYWASWSQDGTAFSGSLLRFFVNPSDTTDYLVYQQAAWISSDILARVAPADAAHNYRGLFSEDVYALWARALDSKGNAISTNAAGVLFAPYSYDSRQGYIDSRGVVHPPSSLPAMVELALVAADARTSRMLRQSYPATSYATSPANFWSDVTNYVSAFPAEIRAGIHVYSTRIVLSNAH